VLCHVTMHGGGGGSCVSEHRIDATGLKARRQGGILGKAEKP